MACLRLSEKGLLIGAVLKMNTMDGWRVWPYYARRSNDTCCTACAPICSAFNHLTVEIDEALDQLDRVYAQFNKQA